MQMQKQQRNRKKVVKGVMRWWKNVMWKRSTPFQLKFIRNTQQRFFVFVPSRIFYYDSPNAKTETKYRPMPWNAMVNPIFNVSSATFHLNFFNWKKNPDHRISKINRSSYNPHRRRTNPRVTSRLVGIVNHDPPTQIQKWKPTEIQFSGKLFCWRESCAFFSIRCVERHTISVRKSDWKTIEFAVYIPNRKLIKLDQERVHRYCGCKRLQRI